MNYFALLFLFNILFSFYSSIFAGFISYPFIPYFMLMMFLFICFDGAMYAQFLRLLFEEIDQDGSGAIDKGEFRQLLRKLNLSYTYVIRFFY